jgi:hypothetical protein
MVQDNETLRIILDSWNKGIISRTPAERIPIDSFSDSENIDLDTKLLPMKVLGHSKYNATTLGAYPVRGACLFTRTDGTKYYVVACGGKLYYSLAGSGTFAAYQISSADVTFSTDTDVEFAQYNNKLYVVTGLYPVITNAAHTTDRMLKIDGTTVTGLTISDIPQALKYIWVHQERLFGAGASGTPNGLFWTNAYFDYSTNAETNWTPTTGLNYDYVGKDDGESIAALFSYQGFMLVIKPKNIYRYATTGDITTWTSFRVDSNHGTPFHRTVKEMNGYAYWFSREGVVRFNGSSTEFVDDPIKDKILGLPQLVSNVRQWFISTGAEFSEGFYTFLIGIVAQVYISPYTASDPLWAQSTKTNIDTRTVLGAARLEADAAYNKTVNAIGNSWYGTSPENVNDGDDFTYWAVEGSGIQWDVELGGSVSAALFYLKYQGVSGGLKVYGYSGSTLHEIWSTTDYDFNGLVSFTSRYYTMFRIVPNLSFASPIFIYKFALNRFINGSLITSAGVSTVTPISMGNLIASCDIPAGTTLTFKTRTSPDNATWTSFVDIGSAGINGGVINSPADKYIQVQANFTTDIQASLTPTLYNFYIGSTYRSAIKDLTATPTLWGKFSSDIIIGSETTFWMRSASSSGGIAAATWYQQIPGDNIVSVALNRYIQWEVRFNTTNYSNIPILSNVTINYYLTAALNNPCAYVWKNEYVLNVAASGQTVNSVAYRYNKLNYWLIRTNKHNNVYFIDEDKLISGTSDSDGFVRLNETGSQDDTTNIDSWFTTKKIQIENILAVYRKYVVESQSDQVWTFSYSIDNATFVDLVISSASTIDKILKTIPGLVIGNAIQLKCRQALQDANWKINAIEVHYEKGRTVRSDV